MGEEHRRRGAPQTMKMLCRLLALAWSVAASAALAAESVDVELVLLADASRSIDDDEIAFQRQGYAAAITDPSIVTAMTSGADRRIALAYVEWGDADSQDVVVPWMRIDGQAAAAAFAAALTSAPRRANGPNAIGNAIAAAQGLIEGNEFAGRRRVIDLSADSAASFGGIPLGGARAAALAAGIVINGLAVYCRRCSGPPIGYNLVQAFEERIIGGPGSFVVGAESSDQFTEAVRKKLFLEVAAVPAGTRVVGVDSRLR
jgi:hypothetical protein